MWKSLRDYEHEMSICDTCEISECVGEESENCPICKAVNDPEAE